jgi:hypothetical protein
MSTTQVAKHRGKVKKVQQGFRSAAEQARAGRCGKARISFSKAATLLEQLQAVQKRASRPMYIGVTDEFIAQTARAVASCRTRKM